MQAYIESPIYARTNGYLKKWDVDIGGRVATGTLLADLDTPEVDQELAQSRANRDQIATLDLAKSTAKRYAALRTSDAVSQQEVDQTKSQYTQAQANSPPPAPTSSAWSNSRRSNTSTRRLPGS